MYKFVVLAAVVAVARAGNLGFAAAPVVAAPVVAAPVAKVAKLVDSEFDPNPQYTYAYDVQDALTGDSKNQFETRNGDVVQGRYSLIEADGSRRVVDYTADPINGFNAVVSREPLVKAVAAKIVAPVAKVAPIVAAPVARVAAPLVAAPVARVAAPVAYSAPIAYPQTFARFAAPVAYTAPVAKVAAPLVASPLTYSARFAAPIAPVAPVARVVSPFGYPAVV